MTNVKWLDERKGKAVEKMIEDIHQKWLKDRVELTEKLINKVHPLEDACLVWNFETQKFTIWNLGSNEVIYPLYSYVEFYTLSANYYYYLQDLFSEAKENPENAGMTDEELWQEIIALEAEKIIDEIEQDWDEGIFTKEIIDILTEHPEYIEEKV